MAAVPANFLTASFISQAFLWHTAWGAATAICFAGVFVAPRLAAAAASFPPCVFYGPGLESSYRQLKRLTAHAAHPGELQRALQRLRGRTDGRVV